MKAYIKSIIVTSTLLVITFSFITNPKEILDASIRGLHIWWTIVFPSLLPFFILSELLISAGIVSFLGILLEPLMRLLFRVPGVGGFVLAMGMSSGLPSGAKLSANLRKEKQLTKLEAERLVTFTNTSNPLFIIGAVSTGFFHNEKIGLLLATSHYLSNLLVGFCMRFHGTEKLQIQKVSFSITSAFKALHHKRISEKRAFGQILGEAILSSVNTLLMIGGFIILFSVINKVLQITGIMNFFTILLSQLIPNNIPNSFIYPFLSGLFEITLGSQMISQTEHTTLFGQILITSSILAFGGFSVHAQVASFLATTDIRYTPYLFARVLQSIIAPVCVIFLWKPLYLQHNSTVTVFKNETIQSVIPLTTIGPVITIFSLYVYIFLLFYYQYIRKN